jgi:Skp family chaperone for outer membrane proteins
LADHNLNSRCNNLDTEVKGLINNAVIMESGLAQSQKEIENLTSKITELWKYIETLEKRIQEFQSNAEIAMQNKQVELLNPIIEKVQNAVNAVGQEKGFTYILDKTAGVVVFIGENAIDITADVKAKLPEIKAKLNAKKIEAKKEVAAEEKPAKKTTTRKATTKKAETEEKPAKKAPAKKAAAKKAE